MSRRARAGLAREAIWLAWVVRDAVQTYLVQRWPLFEGEDATDASESESRAQ